MNNYRAVLSVADDILTLPAEVEALPHSSSAFCGAAGSCAPSVGRGHSPLTLVESRHERGRLSSRPTTPYPPPPHSPVGTLFRGTVPENTNQPLGLGFWVSRWRRIKWKGREEDCGGGGGGEGAPGSPLASPPSIPLPPSLSVLQSDPSPCQCSTRSRPRTPSPQPTPFSSPTYSQSPPTCRNQDDVPPLLVQQGEC